METPLQPLSRRLKLGLAAGLVMVLGGGGLLAWQLLHPRPALPPSVTERVLYPVYLPRDLPVGYVLNEASAHIQDEALLFSARHEDGRLIAFTEQAKPKDFDFAAFYQQQLRGTKNLQHVPYPSVMGQTETGARLLSITTDTTWLLITSKTAGEAELRQIAQTLRRR